MLQQQSQVVQQEKRQFSVSLARTEGEVREAQRLRYKVFAEEMGALMPGKEERLDQDRYDEYCEHLLVRDADTNEVVGTYRILAPEQARDAGGYYSEGEFDLSRLAHLRDRMVEVGRSCVHPDYRSGGVITLLWAGMAEYMVKNGYEYLIGCASISMADGGHNAASIYNKARQEHLSPLEWRVFPRCALPLEALDNHSEPALPPLVKGYLRLGAYVCGDPAWDPDFNTADLLVLLPMSRLNQRYVKHFLGK
ncbi:MAG TPA: GNAT family N-acetyltransferase [Gallionellaceae bacterium]|nr:GNAT family N-acetyltransferase [Gallionellaceae bacterium]